MIISNNNNKSSVTFYLAGDSSEKDETLGEPSAMTGSNCSKVKICKELSFVSHCFHLTYALDLQVCLEAS